MSQTPVLYHYANHPTGSVDRVHDIVFANFDISKCPRPWFSQSKILKPLLQRRPDCQAMTIKQLWLPYSLFTCLDCTLVRTSPYYLLQSNYSAPSVPSTSQLLVVSPFLPKYTIHNSYLNVSTTVAVQNFDPLSVQQTIPPGVAAYVKSVTINGQVSPSRCHFDFYDVFRVGGEVVIEVTADKELVDNCGASIPESLSTGGFAEAR